MNRLRRWHRPGLLIIGDAAHAMSPAGGVGINLAIQDAVATANLLTQPLREGRPMTTKLLHRVQRRRMFPARFTQGMQRIGQRALVETAEEAGAGQLNALRLVRRFRLLRRKVGRFVVVGIRPEHVV
jgi:2-polyprenyl-6-methoxyphenol hydroxylase-like FAD-dependent oxidoreductase